MSDRKLPDDRELDDFLAGRGDVSRRYRDGFSAESAPPELDQKILDLAAQSMEREQRARKRAFVVPLSLAASVAVVFSLVLVMRQQTGGLPPPVASDLQKKSEMASPAPAPAEPLREEAPALQDSSAAKIQMQQMQRAEPEAASQAAPEFAPPPAAPAAALAAPGRDEMKVEQRREAAVGAAAAARAKARASDDSRRSATAWLERIRALKEQGEITDAREQLDAFQKAYPDAEVPEDLRSLLRPVTPPTP